MAFRRDARTDPERARRINAGLYGPVYQAPCAGHTQRPAAVPAVWEPWPVEVEQIRSGMRHATDDWPV